MKLTHNLSNEALPCLLTLEQLKTFGESKKNPKTTQPNSPVKTLKKKKYPRKKSHLRRNYEEHFFSYVNNSALFRRTEFS